MTTFAESAAVLLSARAPELAARWCARAVVAAPRQRGEVAASEAVVGAIVRVLERDARWQGEVMRLGWAVGGRAHDDGLAVHHVLRDADLLLAILLSTLEDAVRAGALPLGPGRDGDTSAAAAVADVVSATRRLQRAASLYAQAAASRYLHAVVTTMRARWRLIRHDLRNPLGTIQSALSLMEDETLSLEMRTGPRIRAMVSRNAGSLETLIAEQLHDDVAEAIVAAPQDVSLRDVALAVRRTLREATQLAECDIDVDGATLGSACIDEAAMELTLTTLLLAAIACAHPGDVLRVEGSDASPGRQVALRVARVSRQSSAADPAPSAETIVWDASCLALAASLADEYGGTITESGDAARLLTLPVVAPNSAPVSP